jgi:hypothetical protein
MGSELLFAETMKANNGRYDFEVHEASTGDRYLLVRESRWQQEELVTSGTVVVHMDHLQGFRRAMRVALQFMKSGVAHPAPGRSRAKAYNVEEARQSYPQAYAKWTTVDDDRLRVLFDRGWAIDDPAIELQRKPSAIRSRLCKLGLIQNP